jgi:hypothetical protein
MRCQESRPPAETISRPSGDSPASYRVWSFREGKAVRVRSYYDTYGYAAALAARR